jgi:hypothetical protein
VNLPRPFRGPARSLTLGQTYAAYLSLRLLIFLAVFAGCVAVGLRGLVAVLAALLISGLLSFPLARRQREAIAQQLHNRRMR